LPERVRLVAAPGALRDTELAVLGWRTEDGEATLICRLVDGSSGTIPARWTDLPRRRPAEPVLGTVGTPEGWRLLGARLAGLAEQCPRRGRACGENGGADARAVGVGDGRDGRGGGGVGDADARCPAAVTVALARLAARLLEAERDE
jgi:hypothetical protein